MYLLTINYKNARARRVFPVILRAYARAGVVTPFKPPFCQCPALAGLVLVIAPLVRYDRRKF